MKKTFALILLVCMCFSLCACKSNNVEEVEALIRGIGTVTLESEQEIAEIQKKYNMLTEKEKAQVENYSVLSNAINELDTLTAEGRLESAYVLREQGEIKQALAIFEEFEKEGEINSCLHLLPFEEAYKNAIEDIKDTLLRPDSLIIYEVDFRALDQTNIEVFIDYGAENQGGGTTQGFDRYVYYTTIDDDLFQYFEMWKNMYIGYIT